MVAIALTHKEPGAVGNKAREEPQSQGSREADLVLCRERTGRQHDGRGWQRNSELLHQDPKEKQEIAVRKQDMGGQFHGLVLRRSREFETAGFRESRGSARKPSAYGMSLAQIRLIG